MLSVAEEFYPGFAEQNSGVGALVFCKVGGHRFEIASNLLDGINEDGDKGFAVVTQFLIVSGVNDNTGFAFQGQNVLGEEAVAERTVNGVAVSAFLEVERFGFQLLDELKAVRYRAIYNFVAGVGSNGPRHLNIGVGNRCRTHYNPVVFGCYVENRRVDTGCAYTTNANVAAAGGVGAEGLVAVGSVATAGGVTEEGLEAVGSVAAAGGVGAEGNFAVGSVGAAGGVGEEGT